MRVLMGSQAYWASVGGYTAGYVMCGQCVNKPMVTFPASQHRRAYR